MNFNAYFGMSNWVETRYDSDLAVSLATFKGGKEERYRILTLVAMRNSVVERTDCHIKKGNLVKAGLVAKPEVVLEKERVRLADELARFGVADYQKQTKFDHALAAAIEEYERHVHERDCPECYVTPERLFPVWGKEELNDKIAQLWCRVQDLLNRRESCLQ